MSLIAKRRIYAVRLGLVSYYNYRTSTLQAQLDELQKQRDTTIEKLKAATKYNTTQELLKKYGGSPSPKVKSLSSSEGKSAARDRNSGTSEGGRTSFIPPLTANIPGKTGSIPLPNTPQRSSPQPKSPQSRSPLGQSPPFSADSTLAPLQQHSSPHGSAEFAPNAFAAAPQYAQFTEGSRWYDRLMDVLLGEDESLPRNRLALICKKCRLVNGQAPPGTKRPEDVGKWRCGECGTVNGEETEATKIIATIKEEVKARTERSNSATGAQAESEDEMEPGREIDDGEESDITQYSEASIHGDEISQPKASEIEPIQELETLRRRADRPKGSKSKKT